MTRRSWIWTAVLVLLGLSLALNAFMVGYVAHGLREGAAARSLIESVASIYPPEVRQEFRAVMRENRPRTFAALRELRAARKDLAAAINASSFDPAAVENAMKNVRTATDNLQAAMQGYLLTALKRVKEKPGS